MPSSFSPNLRIELIGDGEQAGAWGNTTNTNLGTVLEAAVSGYVTVSVISANQAFTHANGAADQARNAMIEVTTTTGANFAVYAPPTPKLYTIYNASAYTATIYNSTVLGNTTAAGTGVAIPAGKKAFVFTDGTDFSGIDSFVSPAFAGTPTAPTAAPGTNTTQVATTAFVQAAATAAAQAMYPIGSLYINTSNVANPSTFLGFGTWVQHAKGRVLVGFDVDLPPFDSLDEEGTINATVGNTPVPGQMNYITVMMWERTA